MCANCADCLRMQRDCYSVGARVSSLKAERAAEVGEVHWSDFRGIHVACLHKCLPAFTFQLAAASCRLQWVKF